MGTIDNLIIKAKDLASAAGSKAQEVAEQTKVRVQAAQLKNDIDANYLKLGSSTSSGNRARKTRSSSTCASRRSPPSLRSSELNGRLDEMKRVLRCPECMKENRSTRSYCQRCGASLKEQSPIEPEAAEAPEAPEAPAGDTPE
ncbi:MAG: hypothetical protein ACLVL7_07360 [Anaerotruncus massiliensis (ex Togo et al. 2019)]